MMIDQINKDLKKLYRDKPHRLDHVYGVMDTANQLGMLHDCDLYRLQVAALLHDITKYYTHEEHVRMIQSHYDNWEYILREFNPNILHAFSAVVVAIKQYKVTDPIILGAIEHHTIGQPAMNIYEQILFISDYIEPHRTYESCKQVRKIAFESLDLATYKALDDSIQHYEREKGRIPTIAYQARDYYKQQLEELM